MFLYRIAKTKYIQDLSGVGASRVGGRWNSKGMPVVYTADSTALATLETLVHTPFNLVPKNRSIATIELPDNLEIDTINAANLPNRWWSYPAPIQLSKIGDQWLQQQSTIALSVPSSVTPNSEGRNYLLNPMHPNFRLVSIIKIQEYIYDSRLYEG